jgi:hypothetical protein
MGSAVGQDDSSVALAALVAALAPVFVFTVAAAGRTRARQTCTHGVSSIGPVIMRNGKIIGGDITPHTEACLP